MGKMIRYGYDERGRDEFCMPSGMPQNVKGRKMQEGHADTQNINYLHKITYSKDLLAKGVKYVKVTNEAMMSFKSDYRIAL